MTRDRLQKVSLGVAGITAVGVGASILVVPVPFYESYGIALPGDPSLLSELRAPGASLAALGLLITLGIFRAALRAVAVAAALTIYIAFPMGRIVGLLLDGMPSGGILGALLIEAAIGTLCVVAFLPRPILAARRHALAQILWR